MRPVLVTPELDKEFKVEADVSNFATGEVLSIKCEDNMWRPMAFISKAFNDERGKWNCESRSKLRTSNPVSNCVLKS